MKALVLKQYKEFAFENVPDPVPGAEEVLVRVKACGICGSDVHGMDGSTGRRRPPVIMGHEAAGVIESCGSGVKGWTPGEPVTFDSTIYCGVCHFCRSGQINLCDQRRVLGVSCEDYRQNGAFAEFVTVPQRILYRVPPALPLPQAALVEPFAIALHAVSLPRISLNDTALVVGAGMIGLALVQALANSGCGRVIAADISPERLALAKACGASVIVNTGEGTALDRILGLCGGRGPDLAFEAVGLSQTVDLAVRGARKGGQVVLVGNVAPKIEFPLQITVTRELTIYGSCASKGEYPACLDLIANGKLNPAKLITATAPLAEGAAWFDRLYKKDPALLKVVLVP